MESSFDQSRHWRWPFSGLPVGLVNGYAGLLGMQAPLLVLCSCLLQILGSQRGHTWVKGFLSLLFCGKALCLRYPGCIIQTCLSFFLSSTSFCFTVVLVIGTDVSTEKIPNTTIHSYIKKLKDCMHGVVNFVFLVTTLRLF